MKEKTKKGLIITIWSLFSFAILSVFVSILCVVLFADIPSVEDIDRPDINLATQIISEDGEVLATYHLENRIFVDYNDILLSKRMPMSNLGLGRWEWAWPPDRPGRVREEMSCDAVTQ